MQELTQNRLKALLRARKILDVSQARFDRLAIGFAGTRNQGSRTEPYQIAAKPVRRGMSEAGKAKLRRLAKARWAKARAEGKTTL